MAHANFKERLAIIEPLIMEGYTLKKIRENTDLTKAEIDETIRALNRVGTGIYDEEKFIILKQKIKEKAHSKQEKIEERDYQEYLNQIEYYIISEKCKINDICNKFSISPYLYYKILNSLNDPNSMHYDPKRYEKIKTQVDKNASEKVSKSSAQNQRIYFGYEKDILKLELTQKVAKGEITISEVTNTLHIPVLDYYLYLIKLPDSELKTALRSVLASYGVFINENSQKSLSSFSLKIQKEIVLMALTYRVSYKTIAKMFGVSMKDVILTFKSFNDLVYSLDYLFLETYCEDEFSEKKAYNDAMLYWRKRNELIKSLNEAKKEKDVTKIEEIKKQIKELHSEIDDSNIQQLKGRKAIDLSQEEKDLIARYQLKYYLSSTLCEELLGYSRPTIQSYSASLAERNMIFADKIVLHTKVYQEQNERYAEQLNANFSRRGGSR